MTLLYIFAVLLGVAIVSRTVSAIHSRKVYGLPLSKKMSLSWPSRQIARKYHALPKDNRPYANLYSMLTSLDTIHTVDGANHHFCDPGYEGNIKTMTPNSCYRGTDCPAWDYHSMYEGLVSIHNALKHQQRELEKAAVLGELDSVKDFTQRLREETNLIKTVTKELT